MLSPNTILQKRYRIVRELGHGGMGTVFEAIDQRVNCVVALKQTLPTNDNEARIAFGREAALLANLRHPALPKVMDYFGEDDGDFLVMEFIPGHDLAELLELRSSPFPESQVLQWADELLGVLEYLHGQRPPIVHRDIKPANLKLTKEGEIFLLDFGLAKGSVGQMSTLGTSRSVRGYTPVYASLEQIHSHGTDPRSDIYSLGATLYHLLTGVRPVDAPTRFQVLEDDQTDPLTAIQQLNSSISPHVVSVIHQAMAVSRKHRNLTAAEMRKALSAAAVGQSYATVESNDRVEEKSESSKPRGGTKTIPTPVERVNTGKDEVAVSTKESTSKVFGDKRLLLVLGAVFVVLVLAGLFVWSKSGSEIGTNLSGQPSPGTGQQSSSPGGHTSNLVRAPAGMVYVPGGTFLMGREAGDDAERPPHQVTVKPFFIDADEVTNDDYEKFVKTTNRRPPPTWKDNAFPSGEGRRPVTGVTWDDASDYARWANKRLPSEEEWEFAARGTDGRLYPWGNDWQASANANGAEQAMADVGAYRSTSPFGTSDMVGNAWEWTSSEFRSYPGRGLPAAQQTGDLKVIRGGCYESTKDYATTTYRAGWPARGAPTYAQTGFRLAKDVAP